MEAGCDPPKIKTSNGIYYWTERGTGQQKNFNEGDSIDFSITVKCHGLTGPTNIYCDGVLQLNFAAQRGIYVRLPGKAGHYLVTTEWDYWQKVTWEFDFIEIPAPLDTASAVQPAAIPPLASVEDPQLLFNYTSQSFTVTGDDIIQNIIVHDLSGRVVFLMDAGSRSVNLEFLPEGIYIVEIRTKMENILLKKLVLN